MSDSFERRPRKKQARKRFSYRLRRSRISRLAAEVNLSPEEFLDNFLKHGAVLDGLEGNVIALLPPSRTIDQDLARHILQNYSDELSAWEVDFLTSVAAWRGTLTAKQWERCQRRGRT